MFNDDIGYIGRSRDRLGGIVHGDHAAHDNAAVGVHMLKGRFQMHSTHIFEINVDAFGTMIADFGDDVIYLFIVERSINAGLIQQPGNFFIRTSASDNVAAFELCDLADN